MMKMKVVFDTDGNDLTHDESVVNGVRPYDIKEGNIAFYEIEEDSQEDFFDSLENFHWCYKSAREV